MNPLSDDLSLDHVHPDGNTVEENLVTACLPCNTKKSTRSKEDFIAILQKEARDKAENVQPEIMAIAKVSAVTFQMTVTELKARNNSPNFVIARTHFCKAARKAGYSLPKIGKFIGRHHTTVMHLLGKPEADLSTEEVQFSE